MRIIDELKRNEVVKREYASACKKVMYYKRRYDEFFDKSSFEHLSMKRKERLKRRCEGYEVKLKKAEVLLEAMTCTTVECSGGLEERYRD